MPKGIDSTAPSKGQGLTRHEAGHRDRDGQRLGRDSVLRGLLGRGLLHLLRLHLGVHRGNVDLEQDRGRRYDFKVQMVICRLPSLHADTGGFELPFTPVLLTWS